MQQGLAKNALCLWRMTQTTKLRSGHSFLEVSTGRAGQKPSESLNLLSFQPSKLAHTECIIFECERTDDLEDTLVHRTGKIICVVRYAPDQMLTAAPVSYREGCILLWRRASDQVIFSAFVLILSVNKHPQAEV